VSGAGEPTGVVLHSTLTRRKEPLTTAPDGTVRIYFCGPTVYGRVHIGNARPFVVFSVLKRHLERRGLRVRLVSNVTDVNDKIYDAARAEGIPSDELARRRTAEYVADTDRLGLGRPDAEPTVTGSIPEIIELIRILVDKDLAYPSNGDVYFRVGRFPGYGALSNRRLDEMVSNEPGQKEEPLDFALWKGRKEGEDTWWESPWGPGRPGWHIECSAMAHATLGTELDVHGGGIDLVFPHHENEIAQSEGAHGGRMASIWMHNEMLELAGDKMSKSIGNIATLSDVLDRWPAEVVLTFFLTSHYRSRLPFSEERMADAQAVAARLTNALRTVDRAIAGAGEEGHDPDLARAVVDGRTAFSAALDDDFNTPEAFAALFELVRGINAAAEARRAGAEQLRGARAQLTGMLDVFGLSGLDPGPGDEVPAEVRALVDQRAAARAARDFARADELRDRIAALGWELVDTPEGTQVYPG
jgi:cysteinyl-tRNA synthetase